MEDLWFGFGIIWDPDGPDPVTGKWEAQIKDKSAFANGSLKFWVKTQTPLKVGIKSGGVDLIPAHEDWVDLSGYGVITDNQWRFISIPMSEFNTVDFSNITQFL